MIRKKVKVPQRSLKELPVIARFFKVILIWNQSICLDKLKFKYLINILNCASLSFFDLKRKILLTLKNNLS